MALTKKDDWILDPYAGVGSTIIAALKNERNSIGIEKYKRYIAVGENRILDFKKGNLKLRTLGQPVFVPNSNTRVAKKPEHFLY